ncbi:dTMP kinase [Anaerospora hongkongensis]|uniref:dTMP kinase n=1 Tax=Anaerospora hongkongensis TaxID=244830 RepID=UPI00289A3659|nr:thymidylate kinase [Anaerospora hongkongensis]
MAGKLIIIEAGDGCGKATQTAKLYNRLAAEGYPVRKVEFPNYASPSSALIKMYLGGEFGTQPDAVNAYAASAFFAVDRFASYKASWGDWYHQGGIILADRYTTSNMVHQAVKIADGEERNRFLDWLWDLEFVKFALPVPDQVLFLDVPPQLSGRLLAERAAQAEAKPDIHEQDQDYLVRCYHSYRMLAERYQWQSIECVNAHELKSIEQIHQEIYQSVKKIL